MCVGGFLGTVGAILVFCLLAFTLYEVFPDLFADEGKAWTYVLLGFVFSAFLGLVYGAQVGACACEWLTKPRDRSFSVPPGKPFNPRFPVETLPPNHHNDD